MIPNIKKILAPGFIAMLNGCLTAEGESSVDWTNLPGDWPVGQINTAATRERHEAFVTASQRLPLIETLSCGPFRIALNASPVSTTQLSNIGEIGDQGGRGELFNGYFMTVKLPDGFEDRIRFRKLVFPDLNARISLMQNGEWRDVTNPERTVEPPMEARLYIDLYPSYDPIVNIGAIFDGVFITEQPWSPFYQRSIFWNNGDPAPPKGRYRVSFMTPYEVEWPSGSCEFTLPDMEFEYQQS